MDILILVDSLNKINESLNKINKNINNLNKDKEYDKLFNKDYTTGNEIINKKLVLDIKDYVKWGALTLEQRRIINKLCETSNLLK